MCEAWSERNTVRCAFHAVEGENYCAAHLMEHSTKRWEWDRLNNERGPRPQVVDPKKKMLFCGDCDETLEHKLIGPFWRCPKCNAMWPTDPALVQLYNPPPT